MHFHLILLLIFVLPLIKASDVIDLNPNNFNEKVLKSDLPFMVEFFAPWCGHCKRLEPEWEKAATNLKGIVPLGKVDCTAHQSLCSKYQVEGYPTIKVFSEKGKEVTNYQQERQASAIVRFATNSLPHYVQRIKNLDSLEEFLAKDSELPHVLIFSSKFEISPLMRSLAVTYKGRILFGQVKSDVQEVVEKYSVDSFPTILGLRGDSDPIKFDGSISPESIGNFLLEFVGEEVKEEENSEKKPSTPPKTHKPKPPLEEAKLEKVTPDNIDQVCESQLCVVGFVEIEEETKNIKEEQLQVLNSNMEKFKKDGKFKFVWVPLNEAQSLLDLFSLGSKPSVIVFNAKRQKFAVSEGFDNASSFKLIERVLTGDATYKTISK